MHNSIVLGKTPDSLSNCLMLQIVYYSKAQRKDVQPDTVCLISRGIFTYKKKMFILWWWLASGEGYFCIFLTAIMSHAPYSELSSTTRCLRGQRHSGYAYWDCFLKQSLSFQSMQISSAQINLSVDHKNIVSID